MVVVLVVIIIIPNFNGKMREKKKFHNFSRDTVLQAEELGLQSRESGLQAQVLSPCPQSPTLGASETELAAPPWVGLESLHF